MAKNMYQKRKERQLKINEKNDDKGGLQKTDINWYPGHMAKTKKDLEKIMPIIDIVYELVDARIPYSSKIKDIDNLIKNKRRILIMTKKDLCDLNVTNKWIKYYEEKGYNVLLIDLNDNNDYKKIIDLTEELSKEINDKRTLKGLKPKEIKSVVIGVPNVGKSTLINKMAGRKVSNVGNLPGVTKNATWLKTKYKLLILDTPGILWPRFDNEKVALNLASMTAISEDVLPLSEVAYYILKVLNDNYKNVILDRFKVEELNDDTFDQIAKNIGAIKNDVPDYQRVYKLIINEIKLEHIKGITFDRGI